MFSRRLFVFTAGCVGLAALAGCGNKNVSFATVSGTVSYNGNPVDGAKVTFHSTVEVDGKKQAYGCQTDSSGKFLIATVGKDPGIPAGLYKVTIVKYEGKGIEMQEGMDAGQMDAMISDTGGNVKGGPVNLLPKEYSNPNNTKLSVTLDVGKNENKDFPLTGK
jgi:hypothetical protein